ncbi:MAG: hypothetical protein P8Z81_12830 [Deinococcales bacterium]
MSPTGRRTRLLLLTAVAGLAMALAGCSRHTAVTVQADLVPFLSQSQTQASASYLATTGSADIRLPFSTLATNPGALIDLSQLGVPSSAFSVIDAFGLTATAAIDPTSAIGPLTATLYVADASASDAFQAQYQAKQVQLPSLPAGQTTTVIASFQLDSQNNAAALARIQSGSFRLGVEIQGSVQNNGTATITLSQLLVSASLPPGWGLP